MRLRPDHPAVTDDDRPLLTPRTVTAAVAGAVTFVLALAMLVITPPYAIQSPGPTVDTLGDAPGTDVPLITVEGTETYPTDGELRLTTVSTRGGPGFPATAAQVVGGWLSGTTTVMPREAAFDPEQTREDVEQESTLQMSSSQTNATVAALTELGYDVPTELRVAGTSPHGPTTGLLEEGDTLVSIAAGAGPTELTSFAVLSDVLADTPPGSTVTLGVERAGEETPVEVVTADDGDGGSLLGVMISPEVELPVDVGFAIENIGGPSAGLMLTLGIVDMLTPGSLTGGAVVAGTGTVDLAGDVGPIGGIAQKLAGAERDGAEWFLAPVENCDEVTGAVPDGLEVVAVDTVSDAVAALEAVTEGRTGDLERCPAP
ncbi:signal protein PDZ [Georgenia satyanarayanai]|uniref:YlbL family protein n=1 Tax=Georgenia satyanarayanai TaxID=860221 RepID=UPI00203FEF78|nr:S16 family serine protease [Georgenia satyanarayanai]MCM3662276.1 signal protein PDZ [Georgenia satyanarayanai]